MNNFHQCYKTVMLCINASLYACMHDRNECSQSAWDKILDCTCETVLHYSTVELGYNVMKGTEYLDKRVLVMTKEYNVTVNSEEFIGTTGYLTL
jgi:hypothetical protein